jgi:UMF1 family MFS transporter
MASPGWISRLGLSRRELRAWAMYDWANSAFFTTVVTAVFPDFFSAVAASGLPPAVATQRFAAATTVAIAIVALIGPLLGAVADRGGRKKPFLAVFTAIGVAATAAMAMIGRGDWPLAAVLFIVGNVGIGAALVFYDSLLPHIAAPDEIDRVSTAGYALGYLGGGILLAVNLAWILFPGAFGLADAVAAIRLSFVSVAVWWAVFAIPLFRRVPEPPAGHLTPSASNAAITAIRDVMRTFTELRQLRHALLMLIAFLLYNDGIQTIIRMASIYGAEIGIDRNARIAAFAMVQFVGIPCAFAFGALADRIGAKRSLFITLAVYTLTSIVAYRMTSSRQFFLLAFLVALVQGGSQALSRSLFASMIPRQKSSEYFGFFSVFEKVAGVLGPAVFGLTIALTGSSRGAVLSVIAFFVLGGLVLGLVDPEAGRRAARAREESRPAES